MAENEFPLAANANNSSQVVAQTNNVQESKNYTEALGADTEDKKASKEEGNSKAKGLKGFFSDRKNLHYLMLLGLTLIFATAIIFVTMSFTSSSSKSSVTERQLGSYSAQEIGKVLDFLDNEGFDYRLGPENSIIVSADEYSSITELMLRKGIALPNSSYDEGDDILMTDQGFGVSQRLESERIKHSREMQLARAIERMEGVEHATVLLAIPRENVFARQKNRPSAAVVVTLRNNAYLSPENVNSIRFMVASSVHNLLSKDVTVTDQHGRQLSAQSSQNTAENKLQREFELRTMREAQYRDKLDSILAPMLGIGNYSSEVDVTLDTTTQEETSQLYNPDNQAVRSETLKEEQGGENKGTPYGVPGSLSNQPPANATIPQQLKDGTATGQNEQLSNSRQSREAVRNYEVDTTVRHTVRPSNVVSRLTVSVAVDYVRKETPDGAVVYEPRPQSDLDKIADLVRGGLGLDERRGDFVHVETVSFPHTDAHPPIPWYEQEFFYRLIRIGGAVLVILILIIFVIRPMLNRLLKREESEVENIDTDELDDQSALEGDDDLDLIARDNELANQVYSINNDGGIELPNLRKEADLLKAVRTLASNEPQLTSEVIKDWLMSDLNKENR